MQTAASNMLIEKTTWANMFLLDYTEEIRPSFLRSMDSYTCLTRHQSSPADRA